MILPHINGLKSDLERFYLVLGLNQHICGVITTTDDFILTSP